MQRDSLNFTIQTGYKYDDHTFLAVCYHVAECFPIKNEVSTHLELILRHKLDAGKHCKIAFGAYCEVHDKPEISNAMTLFLWDDSIGSD